MPSTNEITISYEILNIRFDHCKVEDKGCAYVYGNLISKDKRNKFKATIYPRSDGKWIIKHLFVDRKIVNIIFNKDLALGLVNASERLLRTINSWPGKQSSKGAQVYMNEIVVPENKKKKVYSSFRSKMLMVPNNDWANLWNLIEGRIEADPYFNVQGIENKDIKQSIKNLRNIFPAGWVKGKYRKGGFGGKKLVMGAKLPQDNNFWFPAYHIARTALGAICIDPSLNYLIEIGLSLEDLKDFKGVKKLSSQLTNNPGTQHHFCLAAELHRRNLLIGLEPPTGAGNATNDLLVRINDSEYEVEVKELNSANPIKRLQKEIYEKSEKMPKKPKRPLIFHVVLVDKNPYDKKTEDSFFNAITKSKLILPNNISAIVGGRRFIDSTGGRIKRDSPFKLLNPDAVLKSEMVDLDEIFKSNFQKLKYPIHGIGSNGFSFENK